MTDTPRSHPRDFAFSSGPRTHCPGCGSVHMLSHEQCRQSSHQGLTLSCSTCSAQWAIRIRNCEDLYPTVSDAPSGVVSSDKCELVIQATRPGVPDGWLADQSDNVAAIKKLSPRERQVLSLLLQGRLNKQMGKALEISEKTVEKHRSNIKRKLNVRTTVDMVRTVLLAEMTSPGCLSSASPAAVGEPDSEDPQCSEPAPSSHSRSGTLNPPHAFSGTTVGR